MRRWDVRLSPLSVNYSSMPPPNLMTTILNQALFGRFQSLPSIRWYIALQQPKMRQCASMLVKLLRISLLSQSQLVISSQPLKLQLSCWTFTTHRQMKYSKHQQLFLFHTSASWIRHYSQLFLNRLELRIFHLHLLMHLPGFSKPSWQWSI